MFYIIIDPQKAPLFFYVVICSFFPVSTLLTLPYYIISYTIWLIISRYGKYTDKSNIVKDQTFLYFILSLNIWDTQITHTLALFIGKVGITFNSKFLKLI